VRIIAGSHRGLHLAPVGAGDPAAHLRPTGDRVREAIFNILQNGPRPDPVPGARVLDLFAGTGALGLEALSRGAARATFVENGRVALGLLQQNIALCRMEDRARVIRRDAGRLGPADRAHDLVFLDPPYGRALGEAALAAALEGGWIAPGALVVWEESAPVMPPRPLVLLDQRRYGDTTLSILRHGA
jgi:16S rRNA (guanine966-N2)-methyltransferase